MNTLPDKSSLLIRLALKDLEAIEKNDNYAVNMNGWHTPSTGVCYVCLAGAVMANSLGVSHWAQTSPVGFGSTLRAKLFALDWFRQGNCSMAFRDMDLCADKGEQFNRSISEYNRENPQPFKDDMNALANDLEKAGY